MTLVVLRPNGTDSNTGTVTGAASAHAALNDNSDSSYVTLDVGELVTVNTGDLTLPAGAVVKSIQLRGRVASAINLGIVEGRVDVVTVSGQQFFASQIGAGAPPPSTYSFTASSGYGSGNYTDSEVDSALLTFYAVDPFLIGLDAMNVYEAYLNVTLVTIPVVNVTGPTGTVTNANRPTITWANTLDSDGGAQTHYQVNVFSAAQYGVGGFNPATSPATDVSGIVASSALARQTVATLPDGTYRAYVRVAQTVNGAQHWSAWDFEGFTVAVDLPAAPSMTLTAQGAAARVMVELEDNAGDATTTGFEVQRSVDGATWVAVRTVDGDDGTIVGTAITIYDYEAPNGTLTTYRARALHEDSGSFAASAWVTNTVMWDTEDWWIKHPNLPALNVNLGRGMYSYSDVTRAARQGVFQTVGASRPVVVSDTRGGPTGIVVVQLATVALQDALDVLLDETATVLLQGPTAHGHPDRYVSIGEHRSERVIDKGRFHMTRETLPWTEVEANAGAQLGEQYTADPGDDEELIFI